MIDYPAEDFPISVERTSSVTHDGKNVVVLTLTNGDERRPATLGPLGLERLGLVLDELATTEDIDAVVITGTGRTFCAGANLDTLSSPRNRDDALALAREGHRVLSKLSTLGIPTIAAINGVALGGGLELALHCTHRVAHTSLALMGLPEIGLGVLPGWGGSTLLPRITGLEPALRIMVDNAIAGRNLSAYDAMELGLVDGVADDLLSISHLIIDGHTRSNARPSHETREQSSALIEATIDRHSGRSGNPIDALSRLRAVLLASLDVTVPESFANEDEALAELMMTAEFRRRLYAFRVSSAASKVPAGTPSTPPREISQVGVVGAGLMASQIALLFAEGLDVPVVFSDVEQSRLDAAMDRIAGWLGDRIAKGRLTVDKRDTILSHLHPTLNLGDFAECDLVIEAVFEDLTVKKDVLTALEDVVRPDTILASNTSSLSIDAMATFVEHGERVAGIHFFNPVAVMKLVEVVRGSVESDVTLATAIDISRRLKKTPVIVADEAGFVVNRLLSTFLGEVLRLVESGVSTDAITAALAPLRLPMSPFALIDLIGRTVTLKMMESLHASAPDRFFVGDALVKLESNPGTTAIADDLAHHITSTRKLAQTEIHDTIVDALSREVLIMLDTSVVQRPADIDVCMMNGAGWPSAIGGLTPYLDGSGSSVRASGELIHPTSNFS